MPTIQIEVDTEELLQAGRGLLELVEIEEAGEGGGHANHADLNASEVVEARGSRVLAGDAKPQAVASRRRKPAGTKNEKARAA